MGFSDNKDASVINLGVPKADFDAYQADNAYFVTPETYGAKGDAETDDTQSLQDAINDCQMTGKTLIFQSGKTYLISSTLSITEFLDFNTNGALIKNTNAVLDKVIDINHPSLVADRSRHGKMCYMSFNIDGGGATYGIYCTRANESVVKNTTVRNAINSIHIVAGAETIFDTIYCNGEGFSNSLGIEVNTSDCVFNNIYMYECHEGFKCNGSNHINNFHPWIMSNFNGSIGLEHNGGVLQTNNYYADSYQYPVKKSNSSLLSLNNFRTYYNTEYYTYAYNAPVILYSTDGTQRFQYSAMSNAEIKGIDSNTRLSNVSNLQIATIGNNYTNININDVRDLNNNAISLVDGITADYNIIRANNGLSCVECALSTTTNFGHAVQIGTTTAIPRYLTYLNALLSNSPAPNTYDVQMCHLTIDTSGVINIYRHSNTDTATYSHLFVSGSYVTADNS